MIARVESITSERIDIAISFYTIGPLNAARYRSSPRSCLNLEHGGRVPSYQDGDTAWDQSFAATLLRIQSAVAAALCRRTPNSQLVIVQAPHKDRKTI